jgi:hypothetical protein
VIDVGVGTAALKIEDPRSSDAVESWTLTLVAVEQWLETAKQGDRLIYAHGPTPVRGAAWQKMGLLQRSGDVILHNPRRGTGFDYIAIRNRVRTVAERPRTHSAVGRELSSLMHEVLVILSAAARRGERCPSDHDLGLAMGITVDQAKWQLRKLAAAGFIRTSVVPAPGDPRWRIVEIIGEGISTARPGDCSLPSGPSKPTGRASVPGPSTPAGAGK